MTAKGSPPSKDQRDQYKGIESKAKDEIDGGLSRRDIGEQARCERPENVGNHFFKLSLVDLLV